MSMNLKTFFDLDKVNFTKSELELPYEESIMNKEEIISGMQQIMDIALFYANPSVPDFEDWGAVYSIAETIYEELNND
nr:MAG TPA: hypothetical protein [Caudoviricetes sp.]